MSRYSMGVFAEKTNEETVPVKLQLVWKVVIAISFIMAAGALLLAGVRCNPIKWDVANTLVCVLSIIVMLLISLQVYNVLDMANRIKKAEQKMDEYISETKEDNRKYRLYIEGESNISTANALYGLKRYIEVLYRLIIALRYYSEIETYKDEIKTEIDCALGNCAKMLLVNKGRSDNAKITTQDDRTLFIKTLAYVEANKIEFISENYNNDFNTIIEFIQKIEPILDKEEELLKIDWVQLNTIQIKYHQ